MEGNKSDNESERQWNDNGATMSDNAATMERQWSDNGCFPAIRKGKEGVTMVWRGVWHDRGMSLRIPCVFLVYSLCFPCVFLVYSLCFPCVCLVFPL